MRRLLISAGLALCVCTAPGLTQAGPRSDADLHKLQQDVLQLQAQQEQVLERLDELKQLLTRGNEPSGPNVPATLSVAGETFRGEAKAQLAIIEYADFECPFCRRFHKETYPQIGAAYVETGKLKYFYRDLPLPFHQQAMPAARAARCAAEQGKFWQMHDSLFAEEGALSTQQIASQAQSLGMDAAKLDECMASDRFNDSIQRSVVEAAKMRINGTPTFLIGTLSADGDIVSIKGTVIGAQPFEAFKDAIDPLLEVPPQAAARN